MSLAPYLLQPVRLARRTLDTRDVAASTRGTRTLEILQFREHIGGVEADSNLWGMTFDGQQQGKERFGQLLVSPSLGDIRVSFRQISSHSFRGSRCMPMHVQCRYAWRVKCGDRTLPKKWTRIVTRLGRVTSYLNRRREKNWLAARFGPLDTVRIPNEARSKDRRRK